MTILVHILYRKKTKYFKGVGYAAWMEIYLVKKLSGAYPYRLPMHTHDHKLSADT